MLCATPNSLKHWADKDHQLYHYPPCYFLGLSSYLTPHMEIDFAKEHEIWCWKLLQKIEIPLEVSFPILSVNLFLVRERRNISRSSIASLPLLLFMTFSWSRSIYGDWIFKGTLSHVENLGKRIEIRLEVYFLILLLDLLLFRFSDWVEFSGTLSSSLCIGVDKGI